MGRSVFSETIQSSAPEVRIWEFAGRLLKVATQQMHLQGDRVHAANTSLLFVLSDINQAFFNSFWSVPPKQDLRKIAFILIELAFSTEIFFFFFGRTYIYKYKYLQVSNYIYNSFFFFFFLLQNINLVER